MHPHGHDGQDPGDGVVGTRGGPVVVALGRLGDGRVPPVGIEPEQVHEARAVVLHRHRVVDKALVVEVAAEGAAADVGIAEEPEGAAVVDGDRLGPVTPAPHRPPDVELVLEVLGVAHRGLAVMLGHGKRGAGAGHRGLRPRVRGRPRRGRSGHTDGRRVVAGRWAGRGGGLRRGHRRRRGGRRWWGYDRHERWARQARRWTRPGSSSPRWLRIFRLFRSSRSPPPRISRLGPTALGRLVHADSP